MAEPQIDPQAGGKAFDDFFESIGKQADLVSGDKKTSSSDATNAATANGVEEQASLTDDEPRAVDEIESLCMNCHENVSHLLWSLDCIEVH